MGLDSCDAATVRACSSRSHEELSELSAARNFVLKGPGGLCPRSSVDPVIEVVVDVDSPFEHR